MSFATESKNEVMISIVVPVFNVALYVKESLESIASQDFSFPYEVILVDDCSTDASLEICRQFIEKNHATHFTILENLKNQGVSATRNRGLDEATGRYFMFVDSDDLLPSNALSTLYDAAEKYDVEIVKGNNSIFGQSGESAAAYNVGQRSLIKGAQILTTFYEHEKVRGHPWGKLFRRARLGGYRFPVGVRMGEDLFYCSELFSQASSLILLDRNVYRYRQRGSGSSGSKFESGSYIDWLAAVEKSGQFASDANQKRAHKNLLVRTMAQIARECRKISPASAAPVLEAIEQRCQQWNIRLFDLIVIDRLDLRCIGRYFKLQLALRQIRRNLSRT